MDDLDYLLERLAELSPVDHDGENAPDQLRDYANLIFKIGEYNDPKCIAPLIDSFGYGVLSYMFVVHTLEKYGSDHLIPPLISGLTSQNAGTRMWSATMLGRDKAKDANISLLNLLQDTEEFVRVEAISALIAINGQVMIPKIEPLMNDSSSEVRATVNGILKRYR